MRSQGFQLRISHLMYLLLIVALGTASYTTYQVIAPRDYFLSNIHIAVGPNYFVIYPVPWDSLVLWGILATLGATIVGIVWIVRIACKPAAK